MHQGLSFTTLSMRISLAHLKASLSPLLLNLLLSDGSIEIREQGSTGERRSRGTSWQMSADTIDAR